MLIPLKKKYLCNDSQYAKVGWWRKGKNNSFEQNDQSKTAPLALTRWPHTLGR